MARKKEKDHGFDDGSYVVKKNRKFDIFAFIICLFVALAIWIFAESRANEELKVPSEGESASVTVTAVDTL